MTDRVILLHYPPAPAVPRAAKLREKKKPDGEPENDTEPTAAEKQQKLDLKQQKLLLSARPRVKDIAAWVARKYRGDVDDLEQDGMIVAAKLVPRWDSTIASFPTYVTPRVRFGLLYSLKQANRWRKMTTDYLESHLQADGCDEDALAEMTGNLAMDEVMGLSEHSWPADKLYLAKELFAAIASARAELDPEEQEIIRLHYDEDKELLEMVNPKRRGWSERSLQRKHHDVLAKIRRRVTGDDERVNESAAALMRVADVSGREVDVKADDLA